MEGRAIAVAIPFFFLLIAVELWADRGRRRRGLEPLYRFGDSISSLACGVGQQALQVFAISAVGLGIYSAIYQAAHLLPFSESRAWHWAVAFVLVDLCYWAYHWASHRVNFFWAMHVVHHSSEEYNLSTALRQSWFTNLVSWVFYAPLAILGVPPLMFTLCITLNILYQFWIHTRTVGKLGWFERLFNTPSHHRVHHGIDPEYIDKNYAGVFITWDKLFGTFTAEREEPNFGTVKPLASFNPFWANVEGFAHLYDMSRRTRRLRDKLLVWIKPPEWQPEDLGGPVIVPEVDRAQRRKYRVPTRPRSFAYVATQFAAVSAVLFGLLWYKSSLDARVIAAGGLVVMLALAVWGALLEQRRWAQPLETARLLALGGSAWWLTELGHIPGWVGAALVAIALLSLAGVWLLVRHPAELTRAVRADKAA